MSVLRPLLTAFAVVFLLAGCDSPEERAEKHYQSGLALVQEGKLEQAALEFQNALQENGAHAAARLEFARLLEETGNSRAAVGQYLAVVQQDEDSGPATLALARLSVEIGDFSSAATYAQHAFELLPQDPMARALKASVDFREGNTEAAIEMAKAVLTEAPGNIPARLIVVADRMAAKDFSTAVTTLDEGIGITPDNQDLHLARLASLEGQGDAEAVGRQLQDMVQRFPENERFRQALLQWYLDQKDVDGAIALMREIAERTPDDPTGYLNVAQLILQTSGPEAAREELQRLLETSKNSAPFIQALARLDFELGNRDAAIAALRPLTQGEESSPEKRDAQVLLAKMLLQTGVEEEAHGLVDAVLAEDERHVEALKLRARRLIQEDAPEEALRDMDVANQEAPGDPEVLTIMAAAHQREGAHDLARQRLNLGVEASNFGPAETARYARFLLADQRPNDAEGILLDALRRAPRCLARPTCSEATGRGRGRLQVRFVAWTVRVRAPSPSPSIWPFFSGRAKRTTRSRCCGMRPRRRRTTSGPAWRLPRRSLQRAISREPSWNSTRSSSNSQRARRRGCCSRTSWLEDRKAPRPRGSSAS